MHHGCCNHILHAGWQLGTETRRRSGWALPWGSDLGGGECVGGHAHSLMLLALSLSHVSFTLTHPLCLSHNSSPASSLSSQPRALPQWTLPSCPGWCPGEAASTASPVAGLWPWALCPVSCPCACHGATLLPLTQGKLWLVAWSHGFELATSQNPGVPLPCAVTSSSAALRPCCPHAASGGGRE